MAKISRLMCVGLGLAILTVAFATLLPHPVAAAPAAVPLNVKVTNPQTQPVPTVDAPNQPFGTLLNPLLPDGTIRGSASFTVPSGQRLIIDFIGGNVCLPVGEKAIFDVDVQVGLSQVDYVLPAIPQGTFNGFGGGPCDNFAVSQQVRIYADPDTTVSLAVVRSDSTGSTFAGIGVAGHLVNTQ